MAAPSPADEKSHMSFVDDAIDLDCLDWSGSSGPPSSMLQVPAASSPASSPNSKQPPSLRASNYRAFQSSGSLQPTSGSSSSRKLPEIALDLSSSSASASAGSSPPTGASSASNGHFGTNGGVSLPSPSSSSQQSEAKKKPFLMASLAIGLNEVIPTNNDDDTDNEDDHDRVAIQPKASPGRSPKKFQLGLPQKSPSYALALSPKSASPTGGNGSKLMPISFGCGSGGNGGSGNSHALLKFDPIMGGVGGSSKSIDLEAGAKAQHVDPPSSYRKTIASRSPLRDRSILGNTGENNDFMAAPPKSGASSASFSSLSPSKLDPLDTESIRGSSLTPSGGTSSAFSSERKSMKLPSSSSSPSSSEKTQPKQKQSESKAVSASATSPDKPAAAQPKFRNPFKKNVISTGALEDKSKKGTSAQDDDIDLLGDAHHSSMAQAPVTALTPMDEFNYLSFSPRPGGNSGKQAARDLPSLSLSSDAKDSGGGTSNSAKQQASAASPPPKQTKKPKDKQQQETEQAK